VARWAGCLGSLTQLTGSPEFGRLAALCCIGALTGAATGIFERATRTGWLEGDGGDDRGEAIYFVPKSYLHRVGAGLPDFSFPRSESGPRHAAIHLNQGRIEIEDLPLGRRRISIASRSRGSG